MDEFQLRDELTGEVLDTFTDHKKAVTAAYKEACLRDRPILFSLGETVLRRYARGFSAKYRIPCPGGEPGCRQWAHKNSMCFPCRKSKNALDRG